MLAQIDRIRGADSRADWLVKVAGEHLARIAHEVPGLPIGYPS